MCKLGGAFCLKLCAKTVFEGMVSNADDDPRTKPSRLSHAVAIGAINAPYEGAQASWSVRTVGC